MDDHDERMEALERIADAQEQNQADLKQILNAHEQRMTELKETHDDIRAILQMMTSRFSEESPSA